MDEVYDYLAFKKVDDEETKQRVRAYMEYKYHGNYFDEAEILEEFNESLRLRIVLNQGADMVNKVAFLTRNLNDGRDRSWLRRIVKLLKATYYVKDDIIFEQGEEGEEMYFISEGLVDLIANGKVVKTLSPSSFFGEVALHSTTPQTTTAKASTNCTLYTLCKSDLSFVLEDFPEMAERLEAAAEADRLNQLKETIGEGRERNKSLARRRSSVYQDPRLCSGNRPRRRKSVFEERD
ncbi:hypothetical protein HK102_000836 [Quaeritorhiza haematococci]|nr:hypothetical protein HK102_000836 [Quaeritorhiza haematococci]